MGLMDALRRAGRQSKRAARRSMDWSRHEVQDVQSAMRRKWRVNRPSEVAHDDRRSEELQRQVNRRGIVSVNGQDVNRSDVREREGEENYEVPPERKERDAA